MPGYTRHFHLTSFLSTLPVSLCILSLPILQMKKMRLRMGVICSRFHNQCMGDPGPDFILLGSKTVFCVILVLTHGGWWVDRMRPGLTCVQSSPSPRAAGSPRSCDTKTQFGVRGRLALWVELCSCKRHVEGLSPPPVIVTLFGKKVLTAVMKLRWGR